MGNALAAFEKIVRAGRYVGSVSEMIKEKSVSLPIGLKSKKYTICIEDLYVDDTSDGQKKYVKAICVIPTSGG